MSEKHALIIAVEKYQDSNIKSVKYAENDAKEIAKSLGKHGYQTKNLTLLLSSRATKTKLESVFRTHFAAIEEGDESLIFYAGHGFAEVGRNYITCHDTVLADIIATSIELQSLFDMVRKWKSKNVVFLLDCCHSGLELDESMRSILSEMTDNEFEQFCSESDYNVVFAACDHNEYSYSSHMLKHGIWSYHTIQALNGTAKGALERKNFLTTMSLQNYLSQQVPRTLRKEMVGKVQTPKFWGTLSREAILADFTDIFAKQEKASKSKLAQMKNASLVGYEGGSVQSLSGFKKGTHNVPTYVNDATHSFIHKIGKKEFQELSDELFQDLRGFLKYKRVDLSLDFDTDEGCLSIITPDFTVNASIDIDEDDFSCYVVEVEVTEIKNISVLEEDGFANVFDQYFDRIVFELSSAINIKEVVDKIEEINDDEAITVDYPGDLSWCKVKLNGLSGTLEITPNEITLVRQNKGPVQALLSECRVLPKLLDDHGAIGLLPTG